MATKQDSPSRISHYGTVAFDFVAGRYSRESGSTNWTVRPIDWPGLPGPPPPLGQVLIQFEEPFANTDYSVLVSARRTPDAPMISANYGNVQTTGFVVVLFNSVAPREYQTVRNGDFSFIVMN
jgi:hypothetical protein